MHQKTVIVGAAASAQWAARRTRFQDQLGLARVARMQWSNMTSGSAEMRTSNS
jgi:hypothetical protein